MLRAATFYMTVFLGCLPLAVHAQSAPQASPPARDMPRPDQLEPAVNTTPEAAAPAAEPQPSAATAASPPAPAPAGAGKTPATAAAAGAPDASHKDASARAAAKKSGPDTLQLGTTDITGNRELPKVLYIVPWKRSDLGDLNGRPPNSLLDEVLQPLDRDVFRRENRYYDALKPGPEAPKTDAAQGSGNKP
jgi:hypothetical protein